MTALSRPPRLRYSVARPAPEPLPSARPRALRVGLLGGSFNPAHEGHRYVSTEALKRLALDQVWWLVSPQNPLKARAGMAPLTSRVARARLVAAHPRVKVLPLESRLNTRYTVDTLRRVTAWRDHAFVWLIGADNLAGFHQGREWRRIAAMVPIAVVSRPGYDAPAHSARAMGWLRGFVRPERQVRHWTKWKPPALVLLRLPPDPTSATALRAADPDWHQLSPKTFNPKALRDGVTRRPL